MGMAKRVGKNHYVATTRPTDSPTPVHIPRSVAYSDGEDSHRAPSERTLSEYTSVVSFDLLRRSLKKMTNNFLSEAIYDS